MQGAEIVHGLSRWWNVNPSDRIKLWCLLCRHLFPCAVCTRTRARSYTHLRYKHNSFLFYKLTFSSPADTSFHHSAFVTWPHVLVPSLYPRHSSPEQSTHMHAISDRTGSLAGGEWKWFKTDTIMDKRGWAGVREGKCTVGY